MAVRSRVLAWRTPWTEDPGGLQSTGVAESQTRLVDGTTCSTAGFPSDLVVQNRPANARDLGSIPGLRRPPGGGNCNPLLYCCLGNPGDTGAWRAMVQGVTESQTRLSDSSTEPAGAEGVNGQR